MHSLLDVINYFRHIKDFCEDISPIMVANHWNELVENGKFRPRLAIGELLQLYFSKNILYMKFLFSSIQCTSFIPIVVKYFITYAWKNQPFRYNSWHVGNQCLNPDNIKLSLESLTSSTMNSFPHYIATYTSFRTYLSLTSFTYCYF
jgi:hypothetical protein